MGEKKTNYGGCIYCGQLVAFDTDKDYTDRGKDIIATQECTCDMATKKRNGRLTRSRAEAEIEQMRGEYDYDIIELLKLGASLVESGIIDKLNVAMDSGDKLSVSNAKSGIKVTRIKTKKEEMTV